MSLALIACGISFMVFKLFKISSPVTPSPLESPFTNIPFSYISVAEIPSILGSANNSIILLLLFKNY